MPRDILRPMETSTVRAVGIAVLAPAAATALALPFGEENLIAASSLFLLAVVLAAAFGGRWAGTAAAVLSSTVLTYAFTPPRYTFRVDKTEDVVALVVFLVVAAVVGALFTRVLEARTRATEREREARLLGYLATKLLSGDSLPLALRDAAAALLEPLGLAQAEIRARAGDEEHVASVGRPVEGGATSVQSIVVGNVPFGTITVIRPREAGPLSSSDLHLLEAASRQIAVALERERLDARVETARVESETSGIRAALFSSVTHDLRTPLASIKASVTSLLDEDAELDPAQERDLLETMLEETDRLNRLVGNILDLAKVRAGALVPHKEPTSVEDVLESVLHRMGPRLAGVALRTVVRPDVPEIPADPVQVDQVFTNLLENAARHSPPGGEVLVTVSPWRTGVQVRVQDAGPGIAPKDRERVFEAFQRGEQGTGGSGLGLAIARAIVLAHGGRIWIEGGPTGGTTVVFELPIRDAEPVPQEAGS